MRRFRKRDRELFAQIARLIMTIENYAKIQTPPWKNLRNIYQSRENLENTKTMAMFYLGLLTVNLPQLTALKDMNFILDRTQNSMIYLYVTGY